MDLLNISLETAHTTLGWPTPLDVIDPSGAGASVYSSLIKQKLKRALKDFPQAERANFGVLMADPTAATSEPPLAIIAEFDTSIEPEVLRELQRFCWNFSHAPTVITLEPTLMRVWSCCEAPDPKRDVGDYLVESVTPENLSDLGQDSLEARAARALHWMNLVSGKFFAERADRFSRDGRADQMLLSNLRYIREALAASGLKDDDICHDLLARVIFVQFLFDRRDHDGNPALSATKLRKLLEDDILKERHDSFYSILSNYDETYRLFDWLNSKFNGDLFPGKGETASERAIGWASEKAVVRPEHLALLSEFINGALDMPAQQMCLWPQYAFDVIPLEFISSIYETFVTERASSDGIFYTPPHLVDFILDRVLPWGGENWNLKIIDPACGSGIFLVKAFQRLVHRWKLANPDVPIRAETLRRLLERNIFGVDKDPHAVRVACFSLYLAMCDEIEPRHYWSQVIFPSMRERRLICSDFFSEDRKGFKTTADAGSYDLVVGNAPWGAGVITDNAKDWAIGETPSWDIPNRDIGGLFLAKGAALVKENGQIALIQSANSLLFNVSSTASKFRKRLLTDYTIDAIYNLSALRFRVFGGKAHTAKKSVSPVCVVIMNKSQPPSDALIDYICPKHVRPLVDEFTIMIEPLDENVIELEEAIKNPLIWSELMWGYARDLQLIKKLQQFPSLDNLPDNYSINVRRGIVFGDRKKPAPYLDGRKLFDATMFLPSEVFSVPAEQLTTALDLLVHSRDSTDLDAFQWPQLLVKLSWNKPSGRFHARLNISEKTDGILCNQSYVSVHGDKAVLEAACIAHNSKIAVYFHFLTSGRFAAYRPKLSNDDVLGLPIPSPMEGLMDGVSGYGAIDALARRLFALTDAEQVLIEDALDYTIDAFLSGARSKGKQPTATGSDEGHLTAYCEHVIKVLKAGFGFQKSVSATIFSTNLGDMPYRLIAFQLGEHDTNLVSVKQMESTELLSQFGRLGETFRADGRSLYHQRVARLYEVVNGIPTIFVVKPNEKRFWIRSIGLDDGDKIALDLFRWQQSEPNEKLRNLN